MKLLKIMIVVYVLAIATACGTSKGYVGEKIESSEIAIINGSTNPITVEGKKHKEKVLISKVNQIEVGSYSKGWPKNLKVKEGKNEIEVRHFRTWKYELEYNGGGGLGGMQSGLDNERTMNHQHYILSFDAEKNKSYLISVISDPNDLEKIDFSIINSVTNEKIDFHSTKKIINKSELSTVNNSNVKVEDLINGNVLIYNGAKGLYKNNFNTGRITIRINDKLLGQIDPGEYLLTNIEKGKHHFELLHVDVVNFKSEHIIEIIDNTKIIQVKPTIFSNKLEITNKFPKNFERFKNNKN